MTVGCGDGELAGSLPGLAICDIGLASLSFAFELCDQSSTRRGGRETVSESVANVAFITV
jgi:hypothetical protein